MKRVLSIVLLLLFSKLVSAEHITGGEMFYRLTGTANGQYQYLITLKLYRDCYSNGAQLDQNAAIAVFAKGSGEMVVNVRSPKLKTERLELGYPGPCITNAPTVCYEVGYYEVSVSLPATVDGYTAVYQRCCRINGISNLVSSGDIGATYVADIPGTRQAVTAPANSSAHFIGADTVIVCGGYPFTYSFAAVDPDPTDQLTYSFCGAYNGGGLANNPPGGINTPTPSPPAPPPYRTVSYSGRYNASAPLGASVRIDPNTGLVSGVAPSEGIYVVTVCVIETRNGVFIATQRKDLQIKAGGCDIAKPQLQPVYQSCDGFSYNFSHPSNPLIKTFYWEFGDPASGVNDTSNLQNPTHAYSDTGVYVLKLVTNRNGDCSDSATALVKVFPGFFPAFNSAGICINNPVSFIDQTATNYGVVNSWTWNFGDANSSEDVSAIQNPNWQYTTIGTKSVSLIVGNSKGCLDTISKDITIIDKPPITLAFRDTLMCYLDAVQLQASGTGVFSWTPVNGTIINENTATPTVHPLTTTTYNVQLNEQGCINNDTVRVRVVNQVTIVPMNDSTICLTDPVRLRITSDGLRYLWSPAATLNDATLQNPIATPIAPTTYHVIANIGSCVNDADIRINTVPYPLANAGADSIICYNTAASLHGTHDGSSFFWSPITNMVNSNTLNPTVYPPNTTNYTLTSLDNKGCPKPGRDTVLITVLPKIRPFAGNDTLIVVNQPLQFNASGGVSYVWTPPTNLSDPTIPNPIGTYGPQIDSIRYTVQVFNEIGCFDTASIKVTVFKTNPYVFVPTAFTPNGDGLNDEIRPIAVGVKQIKYFRIFNRWGEMVFTTTINGKGWDGRISGALQGSNVFVWMVSAIDYTGKLIILKGTTTLIR